MGHFDEFASRLEFTSVQRAGRPSLDITRWAVFISGKHTEGDVIPLPEPSTLSLFGMGVLAVALVRRLHG